jgi:hypothetical protein
MALRLKNHRDGQKPLWNGNGEGQNRTGDTTIFSRVLYRLSYLAVKSGADGSDGYTP